MDWIDLRGRVRKVNPAKWRVDWSRIVSRPQKQVKDFLYPYWKNDYVLEEAMIPSTRLRIDLWNLSRSILIEVSPMSTHTKYNPFFHGSLAGYRASIKRDLQKADFARLNKLIYVEIDDSALPLTTEWFLTHHDISL